MGRARQLQALMRRAALGKLDGWKGSIVELLLPIGFAALLILLSLSAGSWELMPRDGVGLKTLPFSSALAMSS